MVHVQSSLARNEQHKEWQQLCPWGNSGTNYLDGQREGPFWCLPQQ